ncbi:MAG: hypothetical protein AAGA77_23685, partial [Bacteroidota bacterium]
MKDWRDCGEPREITRSFSEKSRRSTEFLEADSRDWGELREIARSHSEKSRRSTEFLEDRWQRLG